MSPENKAFGQTGCFGAVVFRRYIKKYAHVSMQSNWNQGKHEGIKVWSVLMHIVVLYCMFYFLLCYFQLGRPLIVVTCFVSNETVSTLSILSIPLLWRAKLMLPSFVICACPVYWNNILQRVRCQPSQCVTCVRQLTIDFWDRNLLHILSKYRKINKLRDQVKHRSRNQKSRNIRIK